jgi:hypothetical protein
MIEQRRKELLQYIAIQWADIHHSRNQDWKELFVVAGVYSALFVANRDNPRGTGLQVAISLTGIFACIVGGYVARAHWRIFLSKHRVIEACERALGIHIRLLQNPLSVQGVILLVYFLLGAPLVGWVIWLTLNKYSGYAAAIAIGASVVVVVLGLPFCWWQQSAIKNEVSRNVRVTLESSPAHSLANPLVAGFAELEACLKLLGEHPLKLIAEAVQPVYKESDWVQPVWAFESENSTITSKPLLALPEDSFQLSVANEQSKQDFHFHVNVLEIYASSLRMEITYRRDGKDAVLAVARGIVIVPPGLTHKVELHGLTLVFQVALGGGQVHNDKVLVKHGQE